MTLKTHISAILCIAIVSSTAYAEDKIIVQVNDTKFDSAFYGKYKIMRKKQNPALPEIKIDKILKSELVNRELLYQAALKDKLDKHSDVKFNLKISKQEVLINAAMQKVLLDNPITEKDVKKEYDLTVKNSSGKEYKARHILVAEEAQAKEIIELLNNGGDFAKLATEKSTGPSNKKGGDLGWFPSGQMVPEFTKALETMKKGTYSKTPVKTRFGWHIIKLENTRTSTPPEFKQVKDRILVHIQNRTLSKYVNGLREAAKVKIN